MKGATPQDIRIVPAGAGAGKTTEITRTLKTWLEDGTVASERILAVTFTEAAAGELRERLRATALDANMTEAALGIERAYISTIHALGLRLTMEHALATANSPAPRLIDEAEADVLLRRSLAQSDQLASMAGDLKRFGYTAGWQKGADAQFRDRVREVVSLLTGLGEAGRAPHLAADAVAALRRDYGPVAEDGTGLTETLLGAVQALLDRFPDGLVDTATNATAEKDFRRDHGNLQRAKAGAASDWRLWEELGQLRQSKRGAPTPDGYDDLAQAVVAAAARIEDHPGPLEDAVTHLRVLIEGAQETLDRYGARKRALGVVDYGDMIAGAEAMLARDASLVDAVLDGIDCVVVDEFQDTNPVQFAFLNHLIARAPRVLLVGDAKQAIMSFQGADARLSSALAARMPETLDPLTNNWRSDPRLMALVNALGPGLFGDAYLSLTPRREETGVPALEVVRVPNARRARVPKARPEHAIAERVRALLEQPAQVIEPATNTLRPVRPSDIAVLCRRHSEVEAYAAALRDQGVPVSREEQGWFAAPVTAALRHALAYAADPTDRHAALCLATLGPPVLGLEHALRAELDGTLDAIAPLPALAALADMAETRPLADFLRRVIDAAALDAWALGQPDPTAARADLMRLLAEADSFAGMPEETAEAAGLHGRGPRAFLGWLSDRAERGDSDRRPPPEAGAGHGVELVTWHSAKGREWPIVVVASLDTRMAEREGALRVEFARYDDPARILETAGLRHCPAAPVPKGRRDAFLEARRPAVLETERCLVYVALTRARDRLILEWPDDAMAKDDDPERPETCAGLLGHEGGLLLTANGLQVGDARFPATVIAGPSQIPDAMPEEADRVPAHRPGRPAAMPVARHTPWRRTPSGAEHTVALRWHSDAYGPPILRAEAVDDASARGTALHLAARVLLTRYDRVGALLDATGLHEDEAVAIGNQMLALRDWLAARGFVRLRTELPVQMRQPDGSEVNGVIDLLAEGDAGFAIIDHKSAAPTAPEAAAAGHSAQLSAYADMVRRTLGRPVALVAVNWLGAGVLTHAAPAPQDAAMLRSDSLTGRGDADR